MSNFSNKDQVIAVASQLFLLRGFANTSMDDVVKESGVSKSNIYYHFKSKEELVLAVLDTHINMFETSFQQLVLDQKGGALERINGFIQFIADELAGRECAGGCPFISLMIEVGQTNEQVREKISQFFLRQKQNVEKILADGVKRGEIRADLPLSATASLLIAWVEGAMVLASTHRDAAILMEGAISFKAMILPS